VQNGWVKTRIAEKPTGSSTVLRWRSRRPVAPGQTTGISIPSQSGDGDLSDATPQAVVRMAAHEQSTDPFDDPFGDRMAQRDSRYQPLPGQPAPADSPAPESADGEQPPSELPSLDDLLAPYDREQPERTDDSTDIPDLPSLDDLGIPPAGSEGPAPPMEFDTQPGPEQVEQPESTEPPIPDTRPGAPDFGPSAPGLSEPRRAAEPKRSDEVRPPLAAPAPSLDSPSAVPYGQSQDSDCKRIYNDRDCCKEDQKCYAARMALKQNSIKSISLDITASFKPDAETMEEENEAEQDQLRKMPSRVWKDYRGQVLAEGRVVDVHHRRIVIEQEDGSTETIPVGQLGQDEYCFLAAWWRVPTECTFGDAKYVSRTWQPMTFTWKASALCHKPLYFEERQLERYGHTTGPFVQPVLSGAHFFLNVAVVPYKMGINPLNECQYSLGYYRPGSCAPWLLPPVPISLRGGLYQAAAITGVAYLFP
jgi:hypothetical protein